MCYCSGIGIDHTSIVALPLGIFTKKTSYDRNYTNRVVRNI